MAQIGSPGSQGPPTERNARLGQVGIGGRRFRPAAGAIGKTGHPRPFPTLGQMRPCASRLRHDIATAGTTLMGSARDLPAGRPASGEGPKTGVSDAVRPMKLRRRQGTNDARAFCLATGICC